MSPSIYYWGDKDHNPEITQRRVLEVLAASPRPMSRRGVQNVVFETDRFGAAQTLAAIRALQDRKLVESAFDKWTGTQSRLWRVTEAGRAALALADAMDDAS